MGYKKIKSAQEILDLVVFAIVYIDTNKNPSITEVRKRLVEIAESLENKAGLEYHEDGELKIRTDLAKRILEYLSELYDEGPEGEGWQSEQLVTDIDTIKNLLKANNEQNHTRKETS